MITCSTYDLWEVSSDRTVGLLGEENSMLIDLVRRLQGNLTAMLVSEGLTLIQEKLQQWKR